MQTEHNKIIHGTNLIRSAKPKLLEQLRLRNKNMLVAANTSIIIAVATIATATAG